MASSRPAVNLDAAAAHPSSGQSPTILNTSNEVDTFETVAATLATAFDAKAEGKLFRDPRRDVGLQPERVFITSWVDYCTKYGMAYALTDGCVGVHFNDSSSVILAADKR